MSKEQLKKKKTNLCSICGDVLSEDFSNFDTHRNVMRMDGGTYSDENYDTVCTKCHAKEHGNYKERNEKLNELKSLYDGYKQIQKTRTKIENQLLAGERRKTDFLDDIDKEFLHDVMNTIKVKEKEKEKVIKKWMKKNQDAFPIINPMLSVFGIGEIFVAACLSYIEIDKANHASSLWSYFGYHTASHSRYDKLTEPKLYTDIDGKEKKRWYSPGNDVLRSQAFVTAGVFIKSKANEKNQYISVYNRRKMKTSNSEKIVKTRIAGKSGNHEMAWKDVSKGHRHGDAVRVMMKHLIADLWYVWRTVEGLPTNDLYVKEHLGHKSAVINPKERGWIF